MNSFSTLFVLLLILVLTSVLPINTKIISTAFDKKEPITVTKIATKKSKDRFSIKLKNARDSMHNPSTLDFELIRLGEPLKKNETIGGSVSIVVKSLSGVTVFSDKFDYVFLSDFKIPVSSEILNLNQGNYKLSVSVNVGSDSYKHEFSVNYSDNFELYKNDLNYNFVIGYNYKNYYIPVYLDYNLLDLDDKKTDKKIEKPLVTNGAAKENKDSSNGLYGGQFVKKFNLDIDKFPVVLGLHKFSALKFDKLELKDETLFVDVSKDQFENIEDFNNTNQKLVFLKNNLFLNTQKSVKNLSFKYTNGKKSKTIEFTRKPCIYYAIYEKEDFKDLVKVFYTFDEVSDVPDINKFLDMYIKKAKNTNNLNDVFAFFGEDTGQHSLELVGSVVKVKFDSKLADYLESEDTIKTIFVETLNRTLCSFDNIDKVEIYVKGELIN